MTTRGSNVNVNDLKDMLASLPQFQTQREQFSLHLDMAQECMGLFEKKKLNVAGNVEQVRCLPFMRGRKIKVKRCRVDRD